MARSYYLGPAEGAVPLETWDMIASAAAAGVLSESQWVELKEQVPPSNANANRELAKDLASLSLDGGILLIGVSDPKGGTPHVVGTDLEGLVTRLSQVAHGSIHPPLNIAIDLAPAPDKPGAGVVVVTIPASLSAPHMVEQRYWGRSAEGKRVLADSEVRLVLSARAAAAEGFEARFATHRTELDPIPDDERHNSHLHLLLEPARGALGPSAREALDTMGVFEFVMQAAPNVGAIPPTIHSGLSRVRSHPEGTLLHNSDDNAREDYALRILVRDDGAIAVFSGRASRDEVAIPAYVVGLTHQAVTIAGKLGRDYLGFNGQWQMGVLIDHMLDRRASFDEWDVVRYPQEEYKRTTTASTIEMTDDTPVVVSRLLSGYLRGLGRSETYASITEIGQL